MTKPTATTRQLFEDNLYRVQAEHLAKVRQYLADAWKPCAHDLCELCHGTFLTRTGQQCVHAEGCGCQKCNGKVVHGSWAGGRGYSTKSLPVP